MEQFVNEGFSPFLSSVYEYFPADITRPCDRRVTVLVGDGGFWRIGKLFFGGTHVQVYGEWCG